MLSRLIVLLVFAACSGRDDPSPGTGSIAAGTDEPPAAQEASGDEGGTQRAPDPSEGKAVAYFAGGCFWCMEGPFEALDGVESVLSGYTDGEMAAPTYEQVSSGDTGHAEAVRVLYDPEVVSYERLLDVFWHNVDPTDTGGQFCDRGSQYRTGIYPVDAEQREAAEASKAEVAEELAQPVVTEISDAGPFWIAEDYHQDFYRTHPTRYTQYRHGCGRDDRLRALWGASAGH